MKKHLATWVAAMAVVASAAASPIHSEAAQTASNANIVHAGGVDHPIVWAWGLIVLGLLVLLKRDSGQQS